MRPGLPGRFTLRGPRGMAGKLEGLAAGSPLGIDGGMASSSAAGDTMAGNQTARLNGAVLAGAGLGRDGVAAAHNAPEGTVIAVQSRPDGGAIGSPDTLAGPRGRQIATGPGEGMLPGKVGAPSTENGIGVDTAGHAPSGSPTARQNHSAGEQDAPNAGAFKAPDDSDSAPKTSGEKIRPTAVHIDGPGVSGPGATIGRSENARPLKIVKPEIPDNLRSEALHVHVIARVTIHKDNTSDVTLTEPSGNDRIDQVVLRALRAWKWQAAFDSTGPREQTVEEKIDLSVE